MKEFLKGLLKPDKLFLIVDIIFCLVFIISEVTAYQEFTTMAIVFTIAGSFFFLLLSVSFLLDFITYKHYQTLKDSEYEK